MKSLIFLWFALFIAVGSHAETDLKHPSKKFQKNYKRYRSFSPKKKKNMVQKWKQFKEQNNWDQLSPSEKQKLKKEVLNRSR